MTSLRLSAAAAFSAPDEMLLAKSRYSHICTSFITMDAARTTYVQTSTETSSGVMIFSTEDLHNSTPTMRMMTATTSAPIYSYLACP